MITQLKTLVMGLATSVKSWYITLSTEQKNIVLISGVILLLFLW